ncbi:reverse transcriptase [Gossypium australe]|uniref:Reverse transcriptase n=1 Tax=Gossypium australe TaxID=47621 RepID=A0A5B6VU74_9ROSI|nr:reverse transcriptase [Gossypium australe]
MDRVCDSCHKGVKKSLLNRFASDPYLFREMLSFTKNFMWRNGSYNCKKGHERKRIHWCSWDKMYELKLDGRLGFRNLVKFYVALLAKQEWRSKSQILSLYQFLTGRTRVHTIVYVKKGKHINQRGCVATRDNKL